MIRAVLLASALCGLTSAARAQAIDARNPIINKGAGVVVGAPTGGQMGSGTVNAQNGVYVNGQAVGGGLTVPSACVLGGNGTALSSVTLGANLSCTNGTLNATGGGGSGTVTSVTGGTANGLTVNVSNGTSTPGISVGTALTGLLKGNGTGVATATAGTDYVAPTGSGAALTGLTWGQLSSAPTTLSGYGIAVTGTGSAVQANGASIAPGALIRPPVIYAASGSISPSDIVSVVNCSTTCSMTLAVSATDGFTHTVKSYGAGTVTLTATIDGSNQAWTMTNVARPYSSFSLVWSATLSTYLAE